MRGCASLPSALSAAAGRCGERERGREGDRRANEAVQLVVALLSLAPTSLGWAAQTHNLLSRSTQPHPAAPPLTRHSPRLLAPRRTLSLALALSLSLDQVHHYDYTRTMLLATAAVLSTLACALAAPFPSTRVPLLAFSSPSPFLGLDDDAFTRPVGTVAFIPGFHTCGTLVVLSVDHLALDDLALLPRNDSTAAPSLWDRYTAAPSRTLVGDAVEGTVLAWARGWRSTCGKGADNKEVRVAHLTVDGVDDEADRAAWAQALGAFHSLSSGRARSRRGRLTLAVHAAQTTTPALTSTRSRPRHTTPSSSSRPSRLRPSAPPSTSPRRPPLPLPLRHPRRPAAPTGTRPALATRARRTASSCARSGTWSTSRSRARSSSRARMRRAGSGRGTRRRGEGEGGARAAG